jgi:hypothetical protein
LSSATPRGLWIGNFNQGEQFGTKTFASDSFLIYELADSACITSFDTAEAPGLVLTAL